MQLHGTLPTRKVFVRSSWNSLFQSQAKQIGGRIDRKVSQQGGGPAGSLWFDPTQLTHRSNMGLSENSVPLNPMVNDHYPY